MAREVMTRALGSGHPVHLNVGFREPLSGAPVEDLVIPEPQTLVTPAHGGDTVTLDPAPGTLVIAGHGAGVAAEAFAVEIGAPLIAEAVSGAHFGPHLVLDYRTMFRELSGSGAITRVITWGRPTLSREVWGLLSDT